MADLIDDVIADIAEAERKLPRSFTFAPVYAFVKNAVHIARGQERQAIIDEVVKLRPKKSAPPKEHEAWDAAISAVIRILVTRAEIN